MYLEWYLIEVFLTLSLPSLFLESEMSPHMWSLAKGVQANTQEVAGKDSMPLMGGSDASRESPDRSALGRPGLLRRKL